MISVVIPALNAERHLAATLSALVGPAVDGIVREVIVVDGGSQDRTREIADLAGAVIISANPGRGGQLLEGAKRARFPWLLFLHADTVLQDGWDRDAVSFMRSVDLGERPNAAGAFRFRLDDKGFAPRALEAIVRGRCSLLRLPYGDQGLLISRRLFDEVGGYNDLPIMEDVDIVRRLGRKRVAFLDAAATTSAERYRRDGYASRALRNQMCLALYGAGLPISTIARIYGKAKPAP
jgi:rSAM/selenodomain-associated transferase 2